MSDDKVERHFDIPVLGRIGYNIKGKVDVALACCQGFRNTMNAERHKRVHVPDVGISIFIPLHTSH